MPLKLIRPAALIGLAFALVALSPAARAVDATPNAPAPAAAPSSPAPGASAPAASAPAPSVPSASAPAAPAPAPSVPSASAPAASAPAASVPAPVPGVSAPAAPGVSAPAPTAPPGASAPEPGKPSEAAPPHNGDGATGQVVEMTARPFAFIEGKADRDEIYASIRASLETVKREIEKAGLKPAGKPIAVFVESDETGFRYHAGFPVEGDTAGKTSLSDAVKLAQTPGGKAMRFQHLAAYADIDATYDAITAYLDEKGIDAQDSFIEEYENDVKDADDPNLQVDIFVMLK